MAVDTVLMLLEAVHPCNEIYYHNNIVAVDTVLMLLEAVHPCNEIYYHNSGCRYCVNATRSCAPLY